MAGQPKTKAQELAERLNELLQRRERDELTVARLKKEAIKLRKTDPFHSYYVLGMIAALEENIGDVRKNFEATLKISPDDPMVALYYFSSLNYLGYFSESLVQAEQFLDRIPDDGTTLRILLKGLWRAGHIHRATKISDRLVKLKQEIPPSVGKSIKDAKTFLSECKLGDQDVGKLVDLSVSVLREEKVFYKTSSSKVFEDEDSRWLSFMYEVERPVAEIVELNYEAARKLAESDIPDEVSDAVIVSFTSSIPS